MRIAWVINLYPPYIVGGNEMLARDIVESMTARGHEVHVLTACGQQFDDIPYIHQVLNYSLNDKEAIFQGGKRLSLVEILRHHVFDLTTYHQVRRVARQLRPDLVVVDNLYMASAAPLLAVQGLGCPVVAQVADKWLRYLLSDLGLLLRPAERWQQQLLRVYVKLVQPILRRLGQPNEMISISGFIKQHYIDAGFPAHHIKPLYLGVDTSLFRPRRQPHVKDDSLEVIFAGQLWEGKGPQVLVDALGRLRQREPDLEIRLRIIGEGNEHFKQHLREQVRKHGMDDRTVFDGFVPLQVLAKSLRNGDIYVFPSTWDEPFSITLVAAMASGIPVIATTTGGTPEALEDGVEGILVPPDEPDAMADAVLRLAHNPALRAQLARAAVVRAQARWSFDEYVSRLEQHYKTSIGKAYG